MRKFVMCTTPARNNAFTLIELLVVIAVLGLLLAIIVPTLSKAKNKAKFMVCKSVLHQYGLAGELYLIESDEVFPAPYEWLYNYQTFGFTAACAWHDIRNDYDVNPQNAGTLWGLRFANFVPCHFVGGMADCFGDVLDEGVGKVGRKCYFCFKET